MIITVDQWAGFDDADAAARWQAIEDYRAAEPESATGRRRAVEDVLEHLCQQVHRALWVPGFDADAWAMLHHEQQATCRGTLGFSEPEQSAHLLTRLSEISVEQRWWPIYDHAQPDPFTLGRVATVAQAATFYSSPTACRWCAAPHTPSSAARATWQRAPHPRADHDGDLGADLGAELGGEHRVVIDLRAPTGQDRLTA